MLDPNLVLGVPPGAGPEEIRNAYYQKRAILQSAPDSNSDFTIQAQLQDLDTAYQTLIERSNSNALAQARAPQPQTTQVDPLLHMVDGIDTPISIRTNQGLTIACPNCGAPTPEKATNCGVCGYQLATPCPNCGEMVPRGVGSCSRCGTVMRELHQVRLAEAEVAREKTSLERDRSQVYIESLEAHHTERRKFGVLFWTAVFILLAAICAAMVGMPFLVEWISQNR